MTIGAGTPDRQPQSCDALKLRRRVADMLTMLFVTGLSLILLVYVGFGEAKRVYQNFYVDKVAAQGRIVQNALERFLHNGLPLGQYAGFGTLADQVVASPEIAAIVAFDQSGRQVFRSIDPFMTALPELSMPQGKTDVEGVRRDGNFYLIVLPLRSRFGSVGTLMVYAKASEVDQRVESAFVPLGVAAATLSFAFALLVGIAARKLGRSRIPWLQISYALTFVTMSGMVIFTLITLYAEGAQGKVQALAESLRYRLHAMVEFDLEIREIQGLDRMLGEYRKLNPDISAAAVIVGNVIHMHTDPSKIGKRWVSDPSSYEYVMQLGGPVADRKISIAVEVPTNIVLRQVFRSVKNFAALFVATGFLAGLFLQVASSIQRNYLVRQVHQEIAVSNEERASALNVVKPIFFVAVFLEHLTYSFLPQYMGELAGQGGLSPGYTAAPFFAYYLCFALALVPAGWVVGRIGERALICLGLMLAGVGLLCLLFPAGLYGAILARMVSGIGQAILFIGVQSYIFAVSDPGKQTQGHSIIVFGFQGGMISGMAIGSLLVTYMGSTGMFELAGVLALITALYSLVLIPNDRFDAAGKVDAEIRLHRILADLAGLFRDHEFVRAILLVGIPAKAILTGVVTFALPLLLASQKYAQEDIGQIIMLYAIGVLVSSEYISRYVDRTLNTNQVLFVGATASGAALFLLGMLGWSASNAEFANTYETFALGAIILGVGVAHGFINAPIITHIASTRIAQQVGVNTVTASYRFLERVGHVLGPLLAGQLLVVFGARMTVLSWIGIGILSLALIFLATMPSYNKPRWESTR